MSANPANAALQHQQFQPFLRWQSPIVDGSGNATPEFLQLLWTLWTRTGGVAPALAESAFVASGPNGEPILFNSLNGNAVGSVELNVAGQAAEAQTLGASPFVFTAGTAGAVVCGRAKVEISRDSGATYYIVSSGSASITPVRAKDQLRISWFSPLNILPGTTAIASSDGTLFAFGGNISVNRGSTYAASLVGGAIRLLLGDSVTVAFNTAEQAVFVPDANAKPTVIFLPD